MEKACLLVVEDQAALRMMLAEAFKPTGLQVRLVGNGKEALEIARQQPPDIVLLDMKLPGMDGLDTLTALRMADILVPCLLMTGMGPSERLQKASDMERVELLAKPFDVLKLRERILSILKKQGHAGLFRAG